MTFRPDSIEFGRQSCGSHCGVRDRCSARPAARPRRSKSAISRRSRRRADRLRRRKPRSHAVPGAEPHRLRRAARRAQPGFRPATSRHGTPPACRRAPQFELDLLGPRALAVAGGIVTLLGIIFFFVLAVNRGWIGPNARVALGGIASAIVFAAGLELKRRYGTTYAALAAVGAGIAGGYATLLSAAALYHMLSALGGAARRRRDRGGRARHVARRGARRSSPGSGSSARCSSRPSSWRRAA